MRRTKIVCTIGPASRSPEQLCALVQAGMNVARMNFSFGEHAYHAENVSRVRAVSAELNQPVAILMDLQGPKLRIGQVADKGIELIADAEVILTTEEPNAGEVPVQYALLPQVVQPGHHILIDDGLIELEAIETTDTSIRCRVITGGVLLSNKGLNLPRAPLSIGAITDKDREDLAFAMSQQADWIALSFVRTAQEVLEIKELVQQHSVFGRQTPVVAKIEKPEAIDNIDEIIAAADGIMVARGDLGIEAAPEKVPLYQKMIIAKCNQARKPVITATQMLDSMIRNPRPTRAEASDVANAILDGTDAIMLSGETAIGKYPVKSVETMARIASYTERGRAKTAGAQLASGRSAERRTIAEAVARASCETACDVQAKAIITPTSSGLTARLVSSFRPDAPIVAVTPSPMVQRQLCLLWGIVPLLGKRSDSTDMTIVQAVDVAQQARCVEPGDLVVVTGGAPSGGLTAVPTDLMKVHRIEKILGQGIGIGNRVVRGRARILSDAAPERPIASDEIIVARSTDRSFVPLVQRAAGLITEDASRHAHAAMLAVELGVPAIIGIDNATGLIQEGQEITLDAGCGRIYVGYVQPGN